MISPASSAPTKLASAGVNESQENARRSPSGVCSIFPTWRWIAIVAVPIDAPAQAAAVHRAGKLADAAAISAPRLASDAAGRARQCRSIHFPSGIENSTWGITKARSAGD
jgi:hypothetical protein